MHSFIIDKQQPYQLRDIETIRTPRLLVFGDRVERNLVRMKSILERSAPNTGYTHICAHAKTHKSALILSRMMEAGIDSIKTTLNEAEMAARCGAGEVFVAYPLLEQDTIWIADLMIRFPETRFFVQIGSMEHALILKEAVKEGNVAWKYFIDVDVGMHRTGIVPKAAYRLYTDILEWDGFEFVGLHGYDGHNHHSDMADRKREAKRSMEILLDVVKTFQRKGVAVERVMAAGSITFQDDLRILYEQLGNNTRLQVSPGNWIYWDSEYDKLLPGSFEIAAVILAQVIEVWESRITLNLGHKRWGADRGPVEVFSHLDLEVVSFNEEHTVLSHSGETHFQIGDYVLIVPRHACSTVNLYEDFTLVGNEGKIEMMDVPVDARNR